MCIVEYDPAVSTSHDNRAYRQAFVVTQPQQQVGERTALLLSSVWPLNYSATTTAAEDDTTLFHTIDLEISAPPVVVLPKPEPKQSRRRCCGSCSSCCLERFTEAFNKPSLAVGRVLVIVAAAIYGTNFAAVKMLNDCMPAEASAFARFLVAATAVAAVVLATEGKAASAEAARERWNATVFGLEIGIWYAVAYVAQAIGLVTVDASKSSFFSALAVVVVPVLDCVFKGKRLSLGTVSAIGLAVVGVALLQLGPSTADATVAASNTNSSGGLVVTEGDFMCFVQALFFGIGYWRMETAATKFSKQASRMTVGMLTGVATGAFIYCISTGQIPPASSVIQWALNPFVVVSILWTGLVSTALALYMETVALKVVSATELTILMTTVSVWGSAFAYVTIGEVLTPIALAGGGLILCSCVLGALFGGAVKTLVEVVVEPEEEAAALPEDDLAVVVKNIAEDVQEAVQEAVVDVQEAVQEAVVDVREAVQEAVLDVV